jgi:glucosamine--fructose-6-phosphate aminotransferase (isomerizing)
MCGIVLYVGRDRAGSVMLDGLRRLEYQGYDSSGMVVSTNNGFELIKRTERVANLEEAFDELQYGGN